MPNRAPRAPLRAMQPPRSLHSPRSRAGDGRVTLQLALVGAGTASSGRATQARSREMGRAVRLVCATRRDCAARPSRTTLTSTSPFTNLSPLTMAPLHVRGPEIPGRTGEEVLEARAKNGAQKEG